MAKQKIIYNRIIPFRGYAAINLFGVIFVKHGVKVSDSLINHELIHTRQQKELLFIGFHILYIIFWIALLFRCKFNSHEAYMRIPFEREAYANQHDLAYLQSRPLFRWLHHL